MSRQTKQGWMDRRFRRGMEMRGGAILGVLAASFAAGLGIYVLVQYHAQHNLIDAYVEARFVEGFCRDRVEFAPSACEATDTLSDQQIHALLIAAKVIEPDAIADANELDNWPPSHEHYDLLEVLRHRREDAGDEPETSLHFLDRLSRKQCLAAETIPPDEVGGAPGNPAEDATRGAASGLAYALSEAIGGPDGPFFNRCEAARKELAGLDGTKLPALSGWRFTTSQCLSDTEVLTRLAVRSGAALIPEEEKALFEGAGYDLTTKCQEPGREQLEIALTHARLEGFTRVQKYVLGTTHTLPEVQRAQKLANLVRGPEHVGIVSLAIFALALLFLRDRVFARGAAPALHDLARDLDASDSRAERARAAVERAKTPVRWSIMTVPAIGFIGTVRGILEALARAGDVVWANDRLERADAIGQLAGELGLAFSTTFFALVVSIALTAAASVQGTREERRLEALEDETDTPGEPAQ